jgi:hypothetical protein
MLVRTMLWLAHNCLHYLSEGHATVSSLLGAVLGCGVKVSLKR